ncbi:hypothetical protein [Trebonia sp.]|uniref:hypothetical protein n=1 Tax=Trebonia sp. TaxID=2767075 RepID=UPI002617F24F|nr:hypothetical protein [Trebonia sp.]
MLSERLCDFLDDWCGLDGEAAETAQMLCGPGGAYYLEWLPTELDQAIREHAITPEFMSTRLGMHFEDQATLDRWLRQRWELWFARPGQD